MSQNLHLKAFFLHEHGHDNITNLSISWRYILDQFMKKRSRINDIIWFQSWYFCLLFSIFPETSNYFYQHCVNCMISILKSCLIPTFFRCQLVGGSNHGGGSSGQQHGGQNGQLGREGHHGSRQKPSNSR